MCAANAEKKGRRPAAIGETGQLGVGDVPHLRYVPDADRGGSRPPFWRESWTADRRGAGDGALEAALRRWRNHEFRGPPPTPAQFSRSPSPPSRLGWSPLPPQLRRRG
jgi:hypothetical protein